MLGELSMDRFCGRERHPVEHGTWALYRDDYLALPTLSLQLRFGYGIDLSEDTQELRAQPSWEVNIVSAALALDAPVVGARYQVPDGYEKAAGGFVTNFYYCSHEQTDNNLVEILELLGTRIRVQITGDTTDVNFYDGSKPKTRLSLEAWLDHDTNARRTMS